MLVAVAVVSFAVSALLLTQSIPPPLRPADFLVSGAVATFVTLGVLFVIVITSYIRDPDTFYKKRHKR
ncbi:MAG: hypothetical protein IT168_07615 [Bryobacterales bacterium]|nr:hypothetical protein [Bryobacterales bacterium]